MGNNTTSMNINVIDNFFSEEIHKEVFYQLIKRPQWSFTGGNNSNPFWHIDGLENDEYFNTYLLNLIRQKTSIDDSYVPSRIYTNGQTAGQCGYPHIDDGHLTFLYFPNLEWEIDWQGHLMFINKEGPVYEKGEYRDCTFKPNSKSDEISEVITYKPNRAVMFPAHIVHYADAPHRLYNFLRISLAYKFEKIK